MKTHSLYFLASASPAFAFPALLDLGSLDLGAISSAALQSAKSSKAAQTSPPFDAASQLVSTSGIHAWKAPGPFDDRGPCPGLNAAANHGYLARNGKPTLLDFIAGTKAAFGMDTDLSTILAVYGGAFDGLVAEWSIGGGFHTGIGGSHNNYETDSSPLRGDLQQYGSNTDLVMSQFRTLYDLQPDPATANYDIAVLTQFRKLRYQESIEKNPYFTYLPFSGAAVSTAAFSFIYRFFANKTAEYPAGILNKEVLKSFMSIYGPEDNLTWVPGHERIPDNWYRRNDADLYGISGLAGDIGTIFKSVPEAGQSGCNTGTVNSYHEIQVEELSGGAYTSADLLANPLCFSLAYANHIADNIEVVNFVVQELLLPVQNLLGCKTVPTLNETVYEACPGYSLYGGPTDKVAPGAIQS